MYDGNCAARRRRQRSMPVIGGITQSLSTIWTGSWWRRAQALSPSAAALTLWPQRSRVRDNSRRLSASSSTTRMCIAPSNVWRLLPLHYLGLTLDTHESARQDHLQTLRLAWRTNDIIHCSSE